MIKEFTGPVICWFVNIEALLDSNGGGNLNGGVVFAAKLIPMEIILGRKRGKFEWRTTL